MDLELTPELKELQMKARKYTQEEIVPREWEMDYDAYELPEADYKRLCQKAKDEGLWCPMAPKEYGGGGLNTFEMCVLHEERVQHRNGLYGAALGTMGREPQAILYNRTPYITDKYVLPTIRSEIRGAGAVTERGGGSDPAGAIQSTAVRDGDDWILNGEKYWASGAADADYEVVYVRTDPTAGRAGISCFIIDLPNPGVTIEIIPCVRPGARPCVFTMKNVRVPGSNIIGEPGQGFNLANLQLTRNRFSYSAANLGVAVAAQRMAVAYSKERRTFGELLSQRQAVQWMLVDSEVEIRATRLLIWEGALKADRSDNVREFQEEAAIAKLYSSEMLGRVVDRAVQIHGGRGLLKDPKIPLERWYRESRIRRIGEGPSEVQRMVIARYILRDQPAVVAPAGV